jgi:hypothetical protein
VPQAARTHDPDEVDFSKLDFGDAAEESGAPEEAPSAPEPVAEVLPVAEPVVEAAVEQPGEVVEQKSEGEPETPPADTAEAAPTRIPKHRFDFVQAKRREAEERAAALEAELAKLRGQQPPKEEGPTFEEVMSKYDLDIEQARLDGDAEKAAKLRGEQRRIELNMLGQQTQFTSQTTVAKAQDEQLLGEVITQLEEAYPQFVEGAAEYDKDLVEEVLELHAAYVARGKRPADAMAKAASYVLRANGLMTDEAETPEPPPAPEPKKTDVTKNVKTAAKQPPPLSGNVGLDSSKAGVTHKMDVMAMKIEDFEKLGEKELESLRGDFDF